MEGNIVACLGYSYNIQLGIENKKNDNILISH